MKLLNIITLILCLFIFSPAFADDMSDDDTASDDPQVHRISDDLDIISTIKYQYGSNPKFFVKSVYPQLDSNDKDENIDAFNQISSNVVKQTVTEFKRRAMVNQASIANLPQVVNRNNLYIDYDTSYIRSGDDSILSIRFTIQSYLAGMAHPYHGHRVLNYDLQTGEDIQLESLFNPGTNYLAVLSNFTRKSLTRHLTVKDMIANGTAPTAENFRNWNIKPNGILITFDEAQVAPYVDGAQSVLVPYSVLKPILSPQSPIAGCVNNRRRCAENNMLTGGFIDQVAVNPQHRYFQSRSS